MTWTAVPEIDAREATRFRRDFAARARFLVDHNVIDDVPAVLADRKWNVETAAEAGLAGRSDEDVLAYAWREDRILITHDRDFLDERRFPPHRNPGIVILPGGSGDLRAVARALAIALPIVGPFREAWRSSCIEVSSEGVISIRNRDKATGARTTTRYRYSRGRAQQWVG